MKLYFNSLHTEIITCVRGSEG